MPQAKPREDQRVRLTKAMLKNAFLQLLAQKPVQNISVKELCERAGVNRGTFYLHYHDVYHLLEMLQGELLDDLDVLLGQTPVIVDSTPREVSSGFMQGLFTFFEKNNEMCTILLGDNGDKRFVASIIERARAKSVDEYLALFPGVERQQADIFYAFVAWGFIGLIQERLQNPAGPSFATIAVATERIIAEASRFFTLEQEPP